MNHFGDRLRGIQTALQCRPRHFSCWRQSGGYSIVQLTALVVHDPDSNRVRLLNRTEPQRR